MWADRLSYQLKRFRTYPPDPDGAPSVKDQTEYAAGTAGELGFIFQGQVKNANKNPLLLSLQRHYGAPWPKLGVGSVMWYRYV